VELANTVHKFRTELQDECLSHPVIFFKSRQGNLKTEQGFISFVFIGHRIINFDFMITLIKASVVSENIIIQPGYLK